MTEPSIGVCLSKVLPLALVTYSPLMKFLMSRMSQVFLVWMSYSAGLRAVNARSNAEAYGQHAGTRAGLVLFFRAA